MANCVVAGGGVLDSLVSQFGMAASGWQTEVNPIARRMFFILFGMEFMWHLVVKKIFAGDIEKLWVFFFTRSVLCFFFARYVIDVAIYQQIIEYFAGIGSRVGGYTLNLTPGNNFSTLGPSEVLSNFACITDTIHTVSDGTGSVSYLTLKLTLALMQVMLLIVLILIAFSLIKIILQTYFLLYAGFILTGFAGSSWTMSFWQRYLQAVFGISIKFLAICFLLGVLSAQMKGWATEINAAVDIVDMSKVILKVLGSATLFATGVSLKMTI